MKVSGKQINMTGKKSVKTASKPHPCKAVQIGTKKQVQIGTKKQSPPLETKLSST